MVILNHVGWVFPHGKRTDGTDGLLVVYSSAMTTHAVHLLFVTQENRNARREGLGLGMLSILASEQVESMDSIETVDGIAFV